MILKVLLCPEGHSSLINSVVTSVVGRLDFGTGARSVPAGCPGTRPALLLSPLPPPPLGRVHPCHISSCLAGNNSFSLGDTYIFWRGLKLFESNSTPASTFLYTFFLRKLTKMKYGMPSSSADKKCLYNTSVLRRETLNSDIHWTRGRVHIVDVWHTVTSKVWYWQLKVGRAVRVIRSWTSPRVSWNLRQSGNRRQRRGRSNVTSRHYCYLWHRTPDLRVITTHQYGFLHGLGEILEDIHWNFQNVIHPEIDASVFLTGCFFTVPPLKDLTVRLLSKSHRKSSKRRNFLRVWHNSYF